MVTLESGRTRAMAGICNVVDGYDTQFICKEPAIVRYGHGCDECVEPWTVTLCAEHSIALDRRGSCEAHGRELAQTEVIDLTKADPGPGYADMLRSL